MQSIWLDEALRRDSQEPRPVELRGNERADVCIVGGGYTGLWTALRLREIEPALDIALVEADLCGAGASGRNGGFMLSWAAKFQTLEKLCGTEEALRLVRASERIATDIAAFCDAHGIEAHLRRDGWLWTASNAAQLGSWDPCLEALAKHGVDAFRRLERGEAQRLSGSPSHLAGVIAPNAATVHPGHLVRGLRRVALQQGIRIFERSPMTALDRGTPPRVRTTRGSVVADRVVLALNAWSAKFRELRRTIVIVGSDIVATDPHPELLAAAGLNNGIAISDSRLFTNYYRTTLDGRLVFGKGGGAFAFGGEVGCTYEGPSPYVDDICAVMTRFYPSFSKAGLAKSWSGPIDRTMSGLPCFGRLGGRKDIVYGFGYSGNGVGPTFLGGKILASMALGLQDEWSMSPLASGATGRFPPEPARYIGSRVVRAAIARKETAEDAGRTPRAADVLLARIAPGGLVPVSAKPLKPA